MPTFQPRPDTDPGADDFGLPFGAVLVAFGVVLLAWAAASPLGLTLSFASLTPGDSVAWPAATLAGGLTILLGLLLWLAEGDRP